MLWMNERKSSQYRSKTNFSYSKNKTLAILFHQQYEYDKPFDVRHIYLQYSIPGDFNRVTVSDVKKLMNGNGSGRVQR